MKRTLLALTLAAVLPLSAHAAEFKIHETDTEIIVEYNGDANSKTISKSVDPAPAEVKPAPVQATASKPKAHASDDDEETQSAGKLARKTQVLTRNKDRVAREARAARMNRDLSTTDPNDYYQPQAVPE